jgi:hypothetical protein
MTSCLLKPRPSFACECVLLAVLWGGELLNVVTLAAQQQVGSLGVPMSTNGADCLAFNQQLLHAPYAG